MKIYILDADVERYRGITLAKERGVHEFTRRFNGTPMKGSWVAKERFAFVPRKLPKGDTPGLSGTIPVFNSRAVAIVADFLEASGQLLPITCEGEDYFLFNVTRLVDALDEDNCDLERFDDGRIMEIDRYAFLENRLTGVVIFKLPQQPLSWVYTTDLFVERVKSAGLRGFKFSLVWSSDK